MAEVPSKFQQEIQEGFQQASAEYGPDVFVLVMLDCQPPTFDGTPRTETVELIQDILDIDPAYQAAPGTLDVVREPAPEGHFHVGIVKGNTLLSYVATIQSVPA